MRARSNQVRTSGVVPRSSAGALLLGLALAASGGCTAGGSTGTSTGNPNDGTNDVPSLPGGGGRDTPVPGDLGGEDALGAGGFCKADENVLASTSTQTELGFSADDVLAFAAGSHDEAIRWHDSNLAIIGPEKGEHRVTIALSYEGGEIRWMTPSAASGGPGIGGPEPAMDAPLIDLPAIGGPGCMPWLEVDVKVTVKSDEGALDESFDATLRARNEMLGTVFVSPEPDELGGSFAPEQILQPDFELAQLDLNINFTPFGVSGRFNGVFETMRSGSGNDAAIGGAAGDKPFAEIGREGCGQYYGAFPVPLDQMVEATTGADVVELVTSARDLAVSWSDGTSSTATLAFTPSQSGACVLLDDHFYDGVTLLVDGQVALQSADGKVDALWAASARAELPESGALQQVKLTVERKSGGAPEGEAHGIPGANVDAYDDSYFTFTLAIANDSAMGELKVTGFEFAPCAGGAPDEPKPSMPSDAPAGDSIPPDQGGGTAGCRGADIIDVLSGAFTLAP
jgi:hypothetical protein